MILLDLAMRDMERLRHENKMTIKELIDGITSERMYRRYIRKESTMPSNTYMALMQKLGMNMIQYTVDLNNHIQSNYPEEHQLVQLIKENRFQEAAKLYESHDFSVLYSENRFRFLPILILYMKLQLKWISRKEYITQANEILDYPKILSYKVLTRVDVEALLVHLLVVDDDDLERIAFFLFRVNEDSSIRVITHEPDITRSDILNVVPFALLRKNKLYRYDIAIIKHLMREFGEYYHPYMEPFRIGVYIRNLITLHTITGEEEKKKMDIYHLFVYIFTHEKMSSYLEALFQEFESYYPSFLAFLEEESNILKMVATDWRDLV